MKIRASVCKICQKCRLNSSYTLQYTIFLMTELDCI